MYRFDAGPAYCYNCGKRVIKPCGLGAEIVECRRLQRVVQEAKLRSKADDEFAERLAADAVRTIFSSVESLNDTGGNSQSYESPSVSGGGGSFGGGGASDDY